MQKPQWFIVIIISIYHNHCDKFSVSIYMSNPNILAHVRTITTANDQLFTLLNSLEQRVQAIELNSNKPSVYVDDLNKITISDLETVVDDVKQSLEYIINQTPRNNEDIKQMKLRIDDIAQRFDKIEHVNDEDIEVLPQKTNVRSIPRLNISVKKTKN